MAQKIQGGYTTFSIQPGRTIIEKDDNTLEGSVVYETDRNREDLLPDIGSRHPDDDRLEMYQRNIVYQNNDEISMNASFFGLTHSPTDKKVTYSGGQNNDPIDTHPDFVDFAGTLSNEENGAVFDPESGAFLRFDTPSSGGADLGFRGTEYYFTAATLVSTSFWTDSVPKLKSRMTVVKEIPGFVSPPDVTEYLLLDSPYRQVGSHYQVTEQYMGAGKKGVNKLIYPD